MTRAGWGRRRQHGSSPIPLTVAGAFLALAAVAFVVAFVGREVAHRADGSWHYERLTLTSCPDRTFDGRLGSGYFCYFQTVPPLPVATDPLLDVSDSEGSSGRAPTSAFRWVHVVDGRVTGTDGRVSLGFLALLLIPAVDARHPRQVGARGPPERAALARPPVTQPAASSANSRPADLTPVRRAPACGTR